MALFILNPTVNTTPDPGQGGSAVTGATNTGHAATTSSVGGAASQSKTCVWTTFQAATGQILSMTLKFDHTSSGSLTGAGAANEFRVEYSLNNGGSWTSAVVRSNFTASQGPTTVSIALSVSQDTTQVRLRDVIQASTLDLGESASATGTVANIKIEVTAVDAMPIALM